jgi:hypothetical protein
MNNERGIVGLFIATGIVGLFIATGLGCFLFAIYLSQSTETYPRETPGKAQPARVEHLPASWGSSEGFALAGGLCFLAAGLVVRNREMVLPPVKADAERSYREALSNARGWGHRQRDELD